MAQESHLILKKQQVTNEPKQPLHLPALEKLIQIRHGKKFLLRKNHRTIRPDLMVEE
jgi:hypothetical protein